MMANLPFRPSNFFLRSAVSILCGIGLLAGCEPKREAAPSLPVRDEVERPPLRLVMIGEETMAGPLELRWKAVSSQGIKIENWSIEKLLSSQRIASDLIMLPSRLLPEAAERGWISPLSSKQVEEFSSESIDRDTSGSPPWPKHWTRTVNYAKRIWGVPLGVNIPVVIADPSSSGSDGSVDLPALFDDQSRDSTHFEATKGQAKTDYLAANEIDDESIDGLIDRYLMLVARRSLRPANSSLAFHALDMRPRITEPAWLEAIEDLRKMMDAGNHSVVASHRQAWNEVLRQEAPWCIGFPDMTRHSTDQLHHSPPNAFRLTALDFGSRGAAAQNRRPAKNSVEVDSGTGWIVAIASDTRQSSASSYFLNWINHSDQRAAFAQESTRVAPFPANLAALSASRPELASFVRLLPELWQSDDLLLELRIRGGEQYRQALGKKLIQALKIPSDSTSLMTKCAQEWEGITEKLGREIQRQSLERSLQLLEM